MYENLHRGDRYGRNGKKFLKEGVNMKKKYKIIDEEGEKIKNFRVTEEELERIMEKIDDIEMYDGMEIEDDEDTEQEDYNRLLRGRLSK